MKKRFISALILSSTIVLALSACAPKPDLVSPTPAGTETHLGSTTPFTTETNLATPDLAETNLLVARLFKDMPEIDQQWVDIRSTCEGYFTNKDNLEKATCVRYANNESDEYVRNFLFIETADAMLSMEFGWNVAYVGDSPPMLANDITGDGLDDLLVSIHPGGSSYGAYFWVFGVQEKSLKMILNYSDKDHTKYDFAPKTFDFGFLADFQKKYQITIRNSYNTCEHTIDLTHMKESSMHEAFFDDAGFGKKDHFNQDLAYDYTFIKDETTGIYQIKCAGNFAYGHKLDAIGEVTIFLKYVPESNHFIVDTFEYRDAK